MGKPAKKITTIMKSLTIFGGAPFFCAQMEVAFVLCLSLISWFYTVLEGLASSGRRIARIS